MAAGLARCPWDRRLPPTGPPSAGVEMFGGEGPFLASLSFIAPSRASQASLLRGERELISRRRPLCPPPWAS